MKALFDKNTLFLREQKIRMGDVNCKILENERVRRENDNLFDFTDGDQSIENWIRSENRIILYKENFPSSEGVQNYKNILASSSLNQGAHVSQYRNNLTADPHLMWNVMELRKIFEKVGGNSSDLATTHNYRPSVLISFGTGDGKFLKEMINTVRPYHLCIALRSFNDLISSFDQIDWVEIWNQYCQDPRLKISFIAYDNVNKLREVLANKFLVSLEHSLMIVPGDTTPSIYQEDRSKFAGQELTLSAEYLGFVCDEYNMIINSIDSLKSQPRLYDSVSQSIGGSFVVCGSGPSLDNSLPFLKNLPKGWSIVACASNYRTLRAAGIDVDILCLLERGDNEYDQYLSVKKEFGLGKTRLFASVTCDGRIHDLFNDSMVYFRPALTPLSIFSSSSSQILPFEGPQTVNTGVAFCAALKADNVVLVGVDLGTTNLDKVRSKNAVGQSPRSFDLKLPGNLQEFVYSTSLLQDGKFVIEQCLSAHSSMNVLNASNGVLIDGATPIRIQDIDFLGILKNSQSNNTWENWWDQKKFFESGAILNNWTAARPRFHVCMILAKIRALMNSEKPWFVDVQDELVEILALKGSPYSQLGPRIFRGVFLKLAIVISRQCYVLLLQDPTGKYQEEFLAHARILMADLCDFLEEEIYELFDEIDSSLANRS